MIFNIKSETELFDKPPVVEYKSYSTNIPFLNDCLSFDANSEGGFRTSRLYTILGCTGSGKSLFLLNIAQGLASSESPVLYISLENTEDQTYDRLESSGLEHNKYLFVSHPQQDPNFGLNDQYYVDCVEQEVIEMERLYNISPAVVVVDYMGEIQPTQGKNSYEEFGNVAKALKELAKRKNICIITASQCNRDALKLYKSATNAEEKLTALCNINESSISDSAKIIHVSDYALFVHRLNNMSFTGYNNGNPVPALFISTLKHRDYSVKKNRIIVAYHPKYLRLSKTSIDLTENY